MLMASNTALSTLAATAALLAFMAVTHGRREPEEGSRVRYECTSLLQMNGFKSFTRHDFSQADTTDIARSHATHEFRMNRTGVPDVIFTHLLKAGGSTVENELKRIFSISSATEEAARKSYVHQSRIFAVDPSDNRTDLELTESPTGDEASMYGSLFRIGLVRSPCDYLLSMWTFQSTMQGSVTGHGTWPHECLAASHPDEDVSKYYAQSPGTVPSTEEDKARFRGWVRASAGSHLHYLSYRSYIAAHHDPSAFKADPMWDDGQYMACLGGLPAEDEQRIADKLQAFDLDARYDCLIHTENLNTELRQCMEKYASTIEDAHLRQLLLDNMDAASWNQKANPTKHSTCSDYYDPNTTAFVWGLEGAFARKAGYATCCA